MSKQTFFYGLVNLALGLVLFISFTLYIPDLISALNVECSGEDMLSCGWLLNMVKMVSIFISIVGLLQIFYWVFFDREKEITLTTQHTTSGPRTFKVCPKCNLANDPTAKFCIECGYEFQKPKK